MTEFFDKVGEELELAVPLADRMRPVSLTDLVGQEHIIGPGKLLRQLIEKDQVPSLILWGPPGTGKTTLAKVIAGVTGAVFVSFSAVTSGVADLRNIIKEAQERMKPTKLDFSAGKNDRSNNQKTILFIDEIHRWNKAQQDALLPYVENGTVTLIGATTENPSFEINAALLSRCRVFVLNQLSDGDLVKIEKRALKDKRRGLGGYKIKVTDKVLKFLAGHSNGDARTVLNALEVATRVGKTNSAGQIIIDEEIIKEALQKSSYLYDKNGDQHYNIISALHKSLRGSDANASLYWLARMLEAGEDPLYVARRLVRFASEDVGLANSQALNQAVAGYQACSFIGLPECNVILAQVVVYLAKCKKSNELYEAYSAVQQDVKNTMDEPVPIHLRNAPTKLMKNLGYGKGYKYSPNFNYEEKQDYLPKKLKGKKWLKEY